MKTAGIQSLLPAFSGLLVRQMGLHFLPERWGDLLRGVQNVSRELGEESTEKCIAALLAAPLEREQIELLARHLTIGETYFFREPLVFKALQEHVLPALIASRRMSGRRLRLWSAGCSTGEEAYSLAILLQRTLPDFRDWDISILGTDINPEALDKAEAGIYGEWSFRNASPWLREGYFRDKGNGRYEILPQIREMVRFGYRNLVKDNLPAQPGDAPAMDIVFCRNVLMYFEPDQAARVVARLHASLADDGWLVVSPSEITQTPFAVFDAAHLPGAILHRKGSAAKAALPAFDSKRISTPRQPSTSKELKTTTTHPPVPSLPDSPTDMRYRQAMELYQQGRHREASALASTLLTSGSRDASAMMLMARIHANLGELPSALYWCEQAVNADRLAPAGHYLLGTILQESERKSEAMLAYRRTLYLDPDFTLAHFSLGNLCRSQNQPRQAAKHFANALLVLDRQNPDDVIPESSGLTARRLAEIIRIAMQHEERAA